MLERIIPALDEVDQRATRDAPSVMMPLDSFDSPFRASRRVGTLFEDPRRLVAQRQPRANQSANDAMIKGHMTKPPL